MQNLMVIFIFYIPEISFFGANLFHKIKIVCLGWILETRLIRICRIRWWFSSFFSILHWKFPFGLIWSESSKFSAETWYLGYFEYIKSNSDVPFFILDLSLKVFSNKIYSAFSRYVISLPAVYSQKLEASGFQVSNDKNNMCTKFLLNIWIL